MGAIKRGFLKFQIGLVAICTSQFGFAGYYHLKQSLPKNPQGGSTVTVSCTPTASGAGVSSQSRVSYKVILYFPQITFSGVTEITNLNQGDTVPYKFITGQQIWATVGLKPDNADVSDWLPGFTITSHKWSEPSGDVKPFKNYIAKNNSGFLSGIQLADRLTPTFKFYTRAKGDSDISLDGVVVVPNGADYFDGASPQNPPSGYNPKSFTAKSYKIQSVKPSCTNWTISTGAIELFPTAQNASVVQFNGPGQNWTNVDIEVEHFGDQGSGCFVQLATPSRILKRQLAPNAPTGTQTIFHFGVTINNVFQDGNGMKGLDHAFPYDIFTPPIWSLTNTGYGQDSPSNTLVYDSSAYGGYGVGWVECSVSDKFETFLMYQPPSVDSHPTVWIPIQWYKWEWTATCTREDVDSYWNLENEFAGITQSPTNTSSHPTWSFLHPGVQFIPIS